MHADKGVDVVCRVARLAGIPLRIAAKMREPIERAYFRERVEPLLGGGIQYVGEVATAAKLQLLGAARCLLNPLRWHEPFGMVMIESLACGTPVVCRPMGAAPEIVTDGVTGALRLDEEALAVAVIEASGFDRGACRQSVATRFSAERLVRDHVHFYEATLATFDGRAMPVRPQVLGANDGHGRIGRRRPLPVTDTYAAQTSSGSGSRQVPAAQALRARG